MTTIKEITIGKRLREKYPGKIPVIVIYDKILTNTDVEKIEKYTIDENSLVSVLLIYVRKSLNLTSSEAIYLLTNNISLSSSTLLIQVYERYKDLSDDCLYVNVAKENVFG